VVKPLVIAHRGDSGHRPENTLASFASALELGAEIVEFDVQLTRDGHAVILHDATVDRTTNGHGRIQAMSLAEVRRLSAGFPLRFGAAYAGERVPTLAEVLHFVRERARALVEIKTDSVTTDAQAGVEAVTVQEIRRAAMEKDVALISFDRRALLRCQKLAPEIVRGHLFQRGQAGEFVAGAREVGCELIMPHKSLLTDEVRERAREAGLKVATWVVDDASELRALRRFDLYGIASNLPGAMMETLRDEA
jgi:glycerophosphoryl diester phosphodiesterase